MQKPGLLKYYEKTIATLDAEQKIKDDMTMVITKGWHTIDYDTQFKATQNFISKSVKDEVLLYLTTPEAEKPESISDLNPMEKL